jgi:hypothetical protein
MNFPILHFTNLIFKYYRAAGFKLLPVCYYYRFRLVTSVNISSLVVMMRAFA